MEWAFPDVTHVSGGELIESLESTYSRWGDDDCMIICRSNKRANIYNQGIRSRILYREEELTSGDRIMVVGDRDDVQHVADIFGNELRRLDLPNLMPIFFGIFLGVLLGSLPVMIPGMNQPFKLGLAGGQLIVAILIGRFGYKLKLVTYTTMSANLMLREIGIALFLASVGVKAGANFLQTVVEGDGMLYVGCGFLITIIPLLIMGVFGRYYYKINYFKLMGLLAGSTTDPPALAYASQVTGSNAPAVGYSTVYPVTMFLRILTAQLLILILAS